MEILGLEITLSEILVYITPLAGLIGYLKHDKKIKEQQVKIQNLQINQLIKTEIEEKMADLRITTIPNFICITNKGKGTAQNIRLEIIQPGNAILIETEKLNYITLEADDEVKLPAFYQSRLVTGIIKIKIIWNDAYLNNREKEIIL